MLLLQHIHYTHSHHKTLFQDLNLTLSTGDKVALIGANGTGKSTLLQLITSRLLPKSGIVKALQTPYFVPQHFGQYDLFTIAQALQIQEKLYALYAILNGEVSEKNLLLLNDDWEIETQALSALSFWGLEGKPLDEKLGNLSGGEKTKVFLAGIHLHKPEFIIMDEPTNHLDTDSRQQLYEWVRTTSSTLLVVSHDRTLLHLFFKILELTSKGIAVYGGSYDFYAEQKNLETKAIKDRIQSQEKALKKARDVEKEARERKQKLDARGKQKQEKAGMARIAMNTLRNKAENSSAKLKDAHTEKINEITRNLHETRNELSWLSEMKLNFSPSALPKGKILLKLEQVQVILHETPLWKQPVDLEIRNGDRVVIKGRNGSGKTTLLKLMLGMRTPDAGNLSRIPFQYVYIDQEYSIIAQDKTVLEQAQAFNRQNLPDHEVKIRLARFLFREDVWEHLCSTLSGGEKLRLTLCCLMVQNQTPDVFVLDEPTNNLDIENIEVLTEMLTQFNGTLLVISHDYHFLQHLQIQKEIVL